MRLLFLLLLYLLPILGAEWDPYKILAVTRRAPTAEIRKAYKRLVKEWHPDKSDDPEAQEKFVEITKAYEILSDPGKRERFDRFGDISDGTDGQQGGGGQGFNFFDGFSPFNFRYQDSASAFAKHRITLRLFDSKLMAESEKKPYVFFVYSDWCISCLQAEPIWEKVVNDLEPIGYGIGAVNNMFEGNLVSRLRVMRLPSVVGLFRGRIFHHRGRIRHQEMVQFARELLPAHLIETITDRNLDSFVGSWKQNKISVLMLGGTPKPRLRYLLAAVRFESFARFGYVRKGWGDGVLRDALNLRAFSGETLVIFNEKWSTGPSATLQSSQITAESIINMIEENKYLLLPRASSQEHFEELCPISASQKSRICAILVVEDASKPETLQVDSFRDFVEENGNRFSKEKIRFLYVFSNTQTQFLEALGKDTELAPQEIARDVVVVWRRAGNKAKVAWLRRVWAGASDHYNRSAENLQRRLDEILLGKMSLSKDAVLKELVDEYGPGVYTRFSRRVMRIWETLMFHVTKDEYLPALSVLGTLAVILLIGYGLNYAVELEKSAELEKAKNQAARARRSQSGQSAKLNSREAEVLPLMRELRGETYFGMLRLLKPGCRSLVVLVDPPRKDALIRHFARCVWPWRNNKTLSFGFLSVDKNIGWFRKLLEEALPGTHQEPGDQGGPDPRLQHINPKQVVGTVLSLNNFRQYFCMYHPKHGPGVVGPRVASASFLGFDDELPDSSDEEQLGEWRRGELERIRKKTRFETEELLGGLTMWLERLFEGCNTIRRYYVAEWPPIK